jgi:hypothetical protein
MTPGEIRRDLSRERARGRVPLLRDGTADGRKYIVGIRANETNRANHDYQNNGQHHRIFGDILTIVVKPQSLYKLLQVLPPATRSFFGELAD